MNEKFKKIKKRRGRDIFIPEKWAMYTSLLVFDRKLGRQWKGSTLRLPTVLNYNTPVKYIFNYQPLTSYNDIQVYGKDATITKKMVIPIEYAGVFKEYDVAYLDGATPNGEENNGDNANYVLLPPKEGNSAIVIYCQKIKGK